MNGFLYILLSCKDNKTYTGSTNDLTERLRKHNRGLVKSTKHHRPLKLIYKETFPCLEKARTKEKYFKSCVGRKKLKELLKDKI